MMKRITMFFVAICLITFNAITWAQSDKQLHEEARFLADKIAYEMKLDKDQLADIYEINYDFLRVAYPLMEKAAAGDEQAITQYYIYLDNRNSDLVWVIPGKDYTRFRDMDALFRPLYLKDGEVRLRVHEEYPNTYYEKKKPKQFGKYRGANSRTNQEDNSSYYKGRHRIVAYGGQPRLLHGGNKIRLLKATKADFDK